MAAPAKLNLDQIVEEATALLRDEGLERITLRRLAARLEVEAPSLYKHIGSKQDLLGLVTVRLFKTQIDQIGPCSTWQQWLFRFGRTLWSTQTRIPDSASLVATTAFTRDQISQMLSWAAKPLLDHGIPPDIAREMHISMQALMLGLSALAEGKNAPGFHENVEIDSLIDHTLQALVDGWELKLASAARPAATGRATPAIS